eukprot:5467669-Ditylum_brightwellii.AAC.1
MIDALFLTGARTICGKKGREKGGWLAWSILPRDVDDKFVCPSIPACVIVKILSSLNLVLATQR